MTYNPADSRPIKKGIPTKKRRELNNLEKRLVHTYTDHDMYAAVMTMLYTGIRRGELIALKWSKISFSEKIISIDSSIYCEYGKFYLKESAKTAAGMRLVPLLDNLLTLLLQIKQSSVSEFVFPKKNGKMHTEASWYRAWESYITYLNYCYYIETTGEKRSLFHPIAIDKPIKFTAHMLRHTYATTLYKAEIGIKYAQCWLGHANASTTLDIYTHIEKTLVDRKASNNLNSYVMNHSPLKNNL